MVSQVWERVPSRKSSCAWPLNAPAKGLHLHRRKLLPNSRVLDMHQLDLAAKGLYLAEPSSDDLGHKLVRIASCP
jgi:hypothetical protein